MTTYNYPFFLFRHALLLLLPIPTQILSILCFALCLNLQFIEFHCGKVVDKESIGGGIGASFLMDCYFLAMALKPKRAFWVCLVCLIILGLQQTLSLDCDPSDLSALKQFVGNLTNGSILSTTWGDGLDCCHWEGVLCDGVRVISLRLHKKGLRGRISHSIGQLDQLNLLDLSSNRLEGELPAEFSKLQNLVSVDLSNNSLSGSIEKAFAGLQEIQSLNISSNLFNGTLFDFDVFPVMTVLNISNNEFSGQLDPRICNSGKKRVIDVSANRLTGDLHSLENCSLSLQQLHVDFNAFSGQIPDFIYSMESLEQLTICGNNFTGNLSEDLSKLSGLKVLVIANNKLSGRLPNVFDNLTLLQQLSAHSNSLSGSLPSSLSECKLLHVLDLRNNSFTGPIDIDFTKLPNLSVLDLASNHLNGTLPSSLSSCKRLRILSLAKNKLTGEVPKNFESLTSLSFISLSNTSLVNLSSALVTLQNCKNLTTLILSVTKNFHGDTFPMHLTGFQSLVVFAIGNCGINGQIPDWLLNCKKLQVLDLSWNHLDGMIPPWIGEMERLFYLDVSNNSLSGEIPPSLTQLKSLISINGTSTTLDPSASYAIPLYVKRNRSASALQYNQPSNFPPSILLSFNRINGTIPSGIGRLKQLLVLDLSRNGITGSIPDSISNISSLEVLDLAYNNLTGSIPPSFAQLNFLSRFSVAYNQLQGQIPSTGQFLSFTGSSYDGNPGLCGVPVLSKCGSVAKSAASAATSSRFSKSTVIGVTVSVGIGLALLLAAILVKLSSRNKTGNSASDYYGDEENGAPRISEGFTSSKLVLFQYSDCKDITAVDLLKSTNNFNQANIIGCGGFGLVYKAALPNGMKVAVKRLSGDCGQMEREFQAEVEALSRAQHANLVSLQGYCQLGNDRLLIYSFMENGSLDYWLHESIDGSSVLSWSRRLKIAKGAGYGLAYLHRVCVPSIVHRDVKSSNILLDENFEAHLADFGLSRLLRPYDTHVTTDLVGTLGYIPPEYSQTLTATFKGDVYSFGVVLLELLTARRPVEVCKGKNCRDLVSWVFQMRAEHKEELVMDASIWESENEKQILEVLNVACKCLLKDPRQRPSIDQVVLLLDNVGVV
ncbi:hypothetical protein V2J09_007341 [Rumex salicifolius]